MTQTDFVGARRPLDEFDIPRMAHRINVSEDHFRAFFEVEAAGRAFDRQGRPVMLFEPHVFYRNLSGTKREQAVAAGLAYAKWKPGAYPKDSYPRLQEAMKIDTVAALKACSIGLSQVLVENHSSVGYETPWLMWQAFMDDEEEHVEAMLRFIVVNGIDDDLRAERWETVARIYNGPRYAENGYHIKMARAFAKHKGIADVAWAPDAPDPAKPQINDAETLKLVQQRLIDLGYPEVGKVDGQWGSKLRTGVLGFRADHGLPIIATVDEQLLSALMVSGKRPVSEERASTTAADLEKAGSRKIGAASKTETVGGLITVGGVIAAAEKALTDTQTQLDQVSGVLAAVRPLLDALSSVSPYLLAALGAYVIYQQVVVKKATVQDYREGKYVGR